MPKVLAGHGPARADGTVISRSEPTEISPTSLGGLSRLLQIPLTGLAPGDYELVLTAKDALSGRQVTSREPFTLVAAEGR